MIVNLISHGRDKGEVSSKMENKHYGSIDGLRTISCIGITMMHVRANCDYNISGFLYNQVIASFKDFVFLFMTISAFGMCCGYYQNMIENKVNMVDFYGKRFKKILPFFGTLVLLDVLMFPSTNSLYEAFADMTLLFGFLPHTMSINIIGVGWFLGLVFVFYICFPFFCVLLQNKCRAWGAFIVSLIYNFVCVNYFDVDRSNILYSACYFLAGGLLYLYKEEIEKLMRWIGLGIVVIAIAFYYSVKTNTGTILFSSVALLSYAVICGEENKKSYLLENKITKFISDISMEIYLSHMAVYRVVERLGLNRMFGNGLLQYIVTVLLVLVGAIVFAMVMQKIIGFVEKSKFVPRQF